MCFGLESCCAESPCSQGGKATGTLASHRRGQVTFAPIKETHKTDTGDQAPKGGEPSWFKLLEEAKIVVHGTLLDLRTLT